MNRKKVVIIILCVMLCLMVVGYASFSSLLQIEGIADIDSSWDIYFESITTKQTVGGASNATDPYVDNLSATISFEMIAPGDKLVYEIALKNNGTIDALVTEIVADKGGAPQIIYDIEGIKKGDKISGNSTTIITVTIEYDPNVTDVPSLHETFLNIDMVCVQYTGSITGEDLEIYQPMLMAATTTAGNTVPFLEGPITRGEIETITFTNTKTVPSGVIDSWDVSISNDYTVMAWYYDSDGDNLYEVYIGQDGGVIASSVSYLFYECTSLTNIDFTYFDTSKATSMEYMFYNCKSLTNLDVSNFNTSKVTNMSSMFRGCSSLKVLDLSSFNTAKVTSMAYMFQECRGLTNLDISSFNTSNVTTASQMFYNCKSLTNLYMRNFNTSKVTSMYAMFRGCSGLTSLDLSSFNTAKVKNMAEMFMGCTSLKSIDLNNFDTKNVTGMGYMFFNCSSLEKLDLSNFNTTNVKTMNYMFYNCHLIEELDLSNFDTTNVTNMAYMFYRCYLVEELDLSNFNTSNVTAMTGMFGGMNVSTLEVTNFNTMNVTDMSHMFSDMKFLTSLDLSSFSTEKLTNTYAMFYGSGVLKTIYVSDKWDVSGVTNSDSMFGICYALTGENGTTYNANNLDKNYAVIDTENTPGYLTLKNS